MILINKPDADIALERFKAWLNHAIIDRVPVQFHRHNMTTKVDNNLVNWDSLKTRCLIQNTKSPDLLIPSKIVVFLLSHSRFFGQIWDPMSMQPFMASNWNMLKKHL